MWEYFKEAIASGDLDLNAFVDFGSEKLTSIGELSYEPFVEDEDWDPEEPVQSVKTRCSRSKTNIFLEAILNDPMGSIVKACVKNGVDVNMTIEFTRDRCIDEYIDEEDYKHSIKEGQFYMHTPLELAVLAKNKKVADFLREAGAKTWVDLPKFKSIWEEGIL